MEKIHSYLEMLPAYSSEEWMEFSPEYREYALQDIDSLRCDIDYAKEKLLEKCKKIEGYIDYLKDTLDSQGVPYKHEY